ncbi:MAG TPA: Hpt domain-containing protein, partial [Anaerolineae bacterium]
NGPALDGVKLAELESLVGGPQGLAALIDSFLEDAPHLLLALRQKVQAGDAVEVRRIAHSLKSNGADFGATAFAGLCRELELLAAAGTLEGAAALADRIQTEYGRVEVALTEARDGVGAGR